MSAAAPAATPPATRRGFFELDLLDNRFPALHGLRVIAIISVVAYHVTWIFAGEAGIPLDQDFVTQSLKVFFGMDLFFILSGFLIGSILLRSLRKDGSQDLRRFYLRRIFRTFPPYYVVLVALALLFPLTSAQRQHLVYELIYGTNFMPLERGQVVMFWGWSLALEEQFYLAVPGLFFVLHRLKSDRARIGLLGVLWLAALVVRLVIFYRHRPWNDFILYGTIYFRTHTRFDTLVAGILLAFVHQRHGEQIAAWLKAPFHRALLALPALACLWLLLQPAMFGVDRVQIVHVYSWGTVTSLMYFGALPLVLYSDGWIQRLLSASIFRRMATLGYGVYLVHIPLIDHLMVPAARSLQRAGHSMLWIWPVALTATMLLSLLIGYGLHVLVEKPSLRLREWLAG